MKNTLKVTLLTAAVAMSTASAFAATGETATTAFQWAGTVPASSTGDLCIQAAAGSTALDSGMMIFKENATTGYDVASSTELRFDVQQGACDSTSGTQVTNYTFELDALTVGVNGLTASVLPADAPGSWDIYYTEAGATAPTSLSSQTSGVSTDASWVGLTVEGSELPLQASDSVVVQAFVIVSDNA